ncbi:hypothetical protein NDU88_007831 [Pleurodeles waltl]|uniref:Uncharacterized protein n=1 Tax=Pleurodeles waltl TaxID=8319 RepID=A0AAV7PME7_PLEWA|nr:hypothetical protein NDU88_007831 [Pleurodeles waltl]
MPQEPRSWRSQCWDGEVAASNSSQWLNPCSPRGSECTGGEQGREALEQAPLEGVRIVRTERVGGKGCHRPAYLRLWPSYPRQVVRGLGQSPGCSSEIEPAAPDMVLDPKLIWLQAVTSRVFGCADARDTGAASVPVLFPEAELCLAVTPPVLQASSSPSQVSGA